MLIHFGKVWNRCKIEKIQFYFRLNKFGQIVNFLSINKIKMPPKKSKRKVSNQNTNLIYRYLFKKILFSKAEASAKSSVVKDPFSASKRSKKDNDEIFCVEKEENIIESTLATEISPKIEKNSSLIKEITQNKNNDEKIDNEDDDGIKTPKKTTKEETSSKYDKKEFESTSNGNDYNLKIVSWNINGIRAWLDVIKLVLVYIV